MRDSLKRVSWLTAEPDVLAREKLAMAERCPEMVWSPALTWPRGRTGAGWEGLAPMWGADRPSPPGVAELLGGRRLTVRVLYPEAFPMVPPDLFPLDPDVPGNRRTMNRWHVNGDGSLCLMQAADDWQPHNTASELVAKASGWFIEYLLVDGGHLDAMTQRGLYMNGDLDPLLGTFA